MLTHAYTSTYIIMTHTYRDCVICLFNTNILYQYINPSLPSLYSRLDFFHNHDIVSRTRELLGCSKGGLSPIASHQSQAFVFCLTYPTRSRPSHFVSHPLVMLTRLGISTHISLERGST